MALPKTMKAIKLVEGHKAELKEVPVPKLRDDYVLVKVKCVALNPTDWKHIDEVGVPGSTSGCDFSGVIVEVGSKVTKDWKVGDRIASAAHGANEVELEDGCFAEYCVAKGDLGFKIPERMSDEDACTLGIGIITVGQGLYQSLKLPLPGHGKFGEYLLIYGGSTATGTLAIQYGVLSGAKVITTSSPRNFPLLKALGAEETFDYKDPDCAEKIRKYTQDKLTHVFDTISEGSSPTICEDCISSTGGAISYLLRAKHTRTDVENRYTLGYTAMGEDIRKRGKSIPAMPEHFEHSKMFWELSSKLIAAGQIAVHPAKVGKGGLNGVFDGLNQLREQKVSGVKLVYRVDETT